MCKCTDHTYSILLVSVSVHKLWLSRIETTTWIVYYCKSDDNQTRKYWRNGEYFSQRSFSKSKCTMRTLEPLWSLNFKKPIFGSLSYSYKFTFCFLYNQCLLFTNIWRFIFGICHYFTDSISSPSKQLPQNSFSIWLIRSDIRLLIVGPIMTSTKILINILLKDTMDWALFSYP